METFTVSLTKLTDKGEKKAVVKYTKSGNYYKGKIIKGSKVKVPQLSSRKNIDSLTKELFEKYRYLNSLESINGKKVRLSHW